jgi:hypothetical protein
MNMKAQEKDDENKGTEVDLNGDGGLEIEVKDDTPPADRGRKPLNKDALAENDEAAQYSEGVKKRLGELRHAAHDERRRKEAAERERDEAINFAKNAMQRAKQLEEQLTYGESAYATEVQEKTKLAIEAATAEHKKAYEAGDPDAMAAAVAKLALATQADAEAKRWAATAQQKAKESAGQKEKPDVDSGQSRKPPAAKAATTEKPDPRAMEWAEANPWFGDNTEMTSLVYGVHERLVKSGVHPVDDADEYYEAIDAEMRKRFPEYEWQDDEGGTDAAADEKKPAAKKATTTKPKSTTVAPVTRTTSGNKNKVVLSETEVRMANKFGLTLEQYAREKVKLTTQGA